MDIAVPAFHLMRELDIARARFIWVGLYAA
jgi:hypothetical protein